MTAATTDRKYIAHAYLAPRDGSPRYTVESEFTAANFMQAYAHVQSFEQKFNARIISHRLSESDASNPGAQRLLFLPPPVAMDRTGPRPPLTVNAVVKEVPPWLGREPVDCPTPLPYPDPGAPT